MFLIFLTEEQKHCDKSSTGDLNQIHTALFLSNTEITAQTIPSRHKDVAKTS